MPGYARVDVRGIEEFLTKLERNPVHAGPWKKALKKAALETKKVTQVRAPYDQTSKHRKHSHMRGTIKEKMPNVRMPLWARVYVDPYGGLDPKTAYRYGGRLEGDPTLVYRSGQFRGSPTQGWWSGSLAVMQPRINQLLTDAAKEVEANWTSL